MFVSAQIRRLGGVAAIAGALLAHDSPVAAQSGPGFELARTSFTSVHQYVAAEAIPTQLATPPNIVVSPMYRQVVEAMLRGSPTFRRQCLRLAADPSLTVVLNMNPHEQRSDVRAKTRMTRDAKGRLSAVVQIAPLQDIQELIAHEFEHIIEQLDGVDLSARARLADTGVSDTGRRGDLFETVRAHRMGLKVASELRPSRGGGAPRHGEQ
jgi:hypothetical protein